jgi:hypothetical protein
MQEILKTTVAGHVKITDNATGEVVLDKKNQIHPKNMATAIARGLSNAANAQIYKLKLGNQGTYIDSSQQIIFKPTTTTGDTAELYNPTYAEIVDDANVSVGVGNSVQYTNVAASTNTRVIITAVISSNEAINSVVDTGPAGTAPGQITGTGNTSAFFFDELGLFTRQTSGDTAADLLDGAGELMLSHLIFSPIEHTGNRELTIVYTLTISVS